MSITHLCKRCSQPIVGNYVTALNADWHPEHFCCIVCQQPVNDAQFYVHDVQPCHPTCYENSIAPRRTVCG